MVEANHSLHQEHPPVQPVNGTVLTLARHFARREVKARIHRTWGYSALRQTEAKDIAKAALVYLAEHPELIDQVAETVRLVLDYEHSPRRWSDITRGNSDDRDNANRSETNTNPPAQHCLPSQGVPDRDRGREVDRGRTQARTERSKGCLRHSPGL